VRLRINGDRLRARECGDRVNHRVLVGRILMDDCDVALTAIWNMNQLFRGIPPQGVDARTVLDGPHDFARARIHDDGCIVAT
jgi:hypothetical protein